MPRSMVAGELHIREQVSCLENSLPDAFLHRTSLQQDDIRKILDEHSAGVISEALAEMSQLFSENGLRA